MPSGGSSQTENFLDAVQVEMCTAAWQAHMLPEILSGRQLIPMLLRITGAVLPCRRLQCYCAGSADNHGCYSPGLCTVRSLQQKSAK